MSSARALYIPIILGTVRQGRMSAAAARFVLSKLEEREAIETEIVDIARMRLPMDGAGEDIKDPEYAEKMTRADALVIVAPEYNHSFPGLLKHVLDTCLEEYIHKAAGIVGVSAGSFGGTRVVQNLLPVLRELGLITSFTDLGFSNIQDVFDANGKLLQRAFVRRTDNFLDELIWMAKTLRYGRENFPSE